MKRQQMVRVLRVMAIVGILYFAYGVFVTPPPTGAHYLVFTIGMVLNLVAIVIKPK
ncbi:MAG TPA: hypothetical protein PKD90_17285 [Phnomibacter sp.]|nr:hypothetical protein [Phnomibacter sp.]